MGKRKRLKVTPQSSESQHAAHRASSKPRAPKRLRRRIAQHRWTLTRC